MCSSTWILSESKGNICIMWQLKYHLPCVDHKVLGNHFHTRLVTFVVFIFQMDNQRIKALFSVTHFSHKVRHNRCQSSHPSNNKELSSSCSQQELLARLHWLKRHLCGWHPQTGGKSTWSWGLTSLSPQQ